MSYNIQAIKEGTIDAAIGFTAFVGFSSLPIIVNELILPKSAAYDSHLTGVITGFGLSCAILAAGLCSIDASEKLGNGNLKEFLREKANGLEDKFYGSGFFRSFEDSVGKNFYKPEIRQYIEMKK